MLPFVIITFVIVYLDDCVCLLCIGANIVATTAAYAVLSAAQTDMRSAAQAFRFVVRPSLIT